MASFLCDFSSAATSFNLSLTIGAHGSPSSAGPAQNATATGCRPGLWRVTYTNGYPAGYAGGATNAGTLGASGSQYGVNPGTGAVGWFGGGLSFAAYITDGSMVIFRDPKTFISGTTWESFFCAGSELTFNLSCPFTTFYDGFTMSAVGAWQQACQSGQALVSS